jgi:two-component sensor histidine kinase
LQKRSIDIELNLAELQARQETLETKLQGQRVSQDRITSLADTVSRIGRGIEKADNRFEARRQLVADIFNVKVTLSYVDGKEDIQATCQLGPGLEYQLENCESYRSIFK